MKPAFELAEIIDRFGECFQEEYNPNSYIQRTLHAIQHCRTSELGGHIDKCDKCGHIRISYNSCRNRHCPKCQNTRREEWVADRKNDLLPVPYFHVVFTVPERLNGLFLENPVKMYNLLFKTAWETMAQFGYTQLQAETGMVALLHTWGQNLSLHPHLHCIVPGGGIDYKGKWKQVKVSENGKVFLYRVENLSKVFRAKFIAMLQKVQLQKKKWILELKKTSWVVYAKEPFSGPEQVVEYLGRYTHKTGISNHRILNIDNQGVTFRWHDYRDKKNKVMRLNGNEFLRRFCLHIMPKGFVRIRHYGLLSTSKRPLLRQLQQAFGLTVLPVRKKKDWKQICREQFHYDPDICPVCGKGKMVVIETFLPQRAPPVMFSVDCESKNSNLS